MNTKPFIIRGHNVKFITPQVARITIKCPFGRTEAATMDQRAFVMNNTQSVVNYMMQEGFLSPAGGINIMVLTSHPKPLK